MSTYYYVACHDCREYGMLPKTSVPEMHADKWIKAYKHEEHDTECASEHDEEFDARVHGREIISYSYYGPTTKQVCDPYKDVMNETL